MKISAQSVYKSLQKYGAIASINIANKLAYPIDLCIDIAVLLCIIAVLFCLHRATATVAPTSHIEKLSLVQTMWIIFFTNIFGDRGIARLLNDEILSGQIAYQLNKPYSYMMFHFAQYIGTMAPSIIGKGLAASLLLWYIVGLPPVTMGSVALGTLMLAIGMVINFCIQFCIGLCAFWIGNTDPLRWIYAQLCVVAGGVAVPLAFFPDTIRNIMHILPFSNTIYGAARIMVSYEASTVLSYLMLQLMWLIIMVIAATMLFKRGVQRVALCGG